MNLDRHALPDGVFVDARAERHHGAHVFMTRSKVLVVRHAALDQCRGPMPNDLEVGGANCNRVDAQKNLGTLRHRHRLVHERDLAWVPKHPRLHDIWNREVRASLHARGGTHWAFL
jgi:hypothetical protein